MFGYHKAHRENKRLQRSQQQFNKEQKAFEKGAPERERLAAEQQKNQATERAKELANIREQAKLKGREDIKSLYSDPNIEGLPEKERQAMQYEANKNITRNLHSANRHLLGEQSQRGIGRRSGVAYAQQRDLQRLAQEGYGGVQRDLDKLNQQRRMQNMALYFTGGQGEAAQALLDYQTALNEAQLAEERKNQRAYQQQMNRLFSRI